MNRRDLVLSCARAAGVGVFAPMINIGRCRLYGGTREYPTGVIDLVGESLVIDMLGLVTLDWQKLDRWHQNPSSFSQADLRVLLQSGVNVFHPAVDLNRPNANGVTRQWLKDWNTFVDKHPKWFLRVSDSLDLERAKSEGKVGILMGMQNSAHFQNVADVAEFHRLGQRVSQLTYNSANAIGTGCMERTDEGLTDFGVQIVRAMNQTRMVVDISHAGDRTSMDAIELSGKPVLVTHANCRALVPHPRCKSDGVIKAMARAGGVIGITGVRQFVRQAENANIEDALDHFDHVARVAGVEALGIGSDTDVEGRVAASRIGVKGLNHGRRVFDLAAGLLRRGYSRSNVALILGGNFQRALHSVFS